MATFEKYCRDYNVREMHQSISKDSQPLDTSEMLPHHFKLMFS